VHNSFLTIFPTLWVLRDDGRALEARDYFDRYVVQAFRVHYADGATTPCFPLFRPVRALLTLSSETISEGEKDEIHQWAKEERNLRFVTALNYGLAHYGRCGESLSVEICLLLTKLLPERNSKVHMVKIGLAIAEGVVSLTKSTTMSIARHHILPIYEELIAMNKQLDELMEHGR